MEQLFASGSIIDLILVIFAVEAAIVFVYLRRSGLLRSGRGVGGLFANIAAGACLLLAVRAALTDSAWQWVALWIGLSLPFHLADLAGLPQRAAHRRQGICVQVRANRPFLAARRRSGLIQRLGEVISHARYG